VTPSAPVARDVPFGVRHVRRRVNTRGRGYGLP
jgi:hypothetical protein